MKEYGTIIRRILDEVASYFPHDDDMEVEKIYDDVRGHFELLHIGWEKKRRVHGCILHLDIKEDKIWIQHDGTEDGIALDLVEAGIPKDHIVLAFHPPYKRPYTGFAIA